MSKKIQVHKPSFHDSQLVCTYTVDGQLFTNSFTFPGSGASVPSQAQDKLCDWIALTGSLGMFSLDYFSEVAVDFSLSEDEVVFFEKLTFLGLGEFRVVNHIPLTLRTKFIADTAYPPARTTPGYLTTLNPLLLNGGGKDGSVSAFLLQKAGISFTWFQRGSSQAQENVTRSWDAPVLIATRTLDENRKSGPYKGHRPMSASIAFIASLSALLTGHDSVIASNEASANEANYIEDGVSVNHQYSKSLEFEHDIQNLMNTFSIPVHYFSLLRPLHELQIACIASNLSSEQLGAITSCNNGTKTATWCLNCAKCAFVGLVMTASSATASERIWGFQPLNLPSLKPYFIELLDPAQQKPFECVGTLEECHLAADIILNRSDAAVSPEAKDMLATYTTKSKNPAHNKLMITCSEHLIPLQYQVVLPLIEQYIKQWQNETIPPAPVTS